MTTKFPILKQVFFLVLLLSIISTACNSKKSEAAEETTSTATEEANTTETETPPTSAEATATVEAVGGLPARFIDEDQLAAKLISISEDIEKQNLDYSRANGTDCSGIYHKIKDRIQQEFPPLGNADKYHFPQFDPDRDARQIARWYHKNGNLKLVKDGNADIGLVRPGTIVFFGQNNKSYSSEQINIDYLTDPSTGIYHIATVTALEKDDAGNTIKYTMMHGRRPGKPAGRTTSNFSSPSSPKTNARHKKFPFGNAGQQLVAIAYLETLKDGADATTATAPTEAATGETSTEQTEEVTVETTTIEVEPATQEPSKPTRIAPVGGLPARNIDEERLSVVLDLIAQDLESQKLAYVSSLGQDCSGIYHKIKDLVQRNFKEFGNSEKYHYPDFGTDRNSRQIAHWYHENGNLKIIPDAKPIANNIRPGTVMFYGRSAEKYNNVNIDMLTNPGKFVHDGTKGKIMHIAVVTKVEKDDAGNVTRYTIMHGRNSKHNASRTGSNYDGPGFEKQHSKFPYGNWNQQLVAMAYIETPK